MSQQPFVSRELSPEDKLLLARKVQSDGGSPQLELLVSLATDPDERVRRAAQEALRNLPDEPCAQALAAPSLKPSVARYFLDPAHVHPALLPILLAHPSAPEEAITALAANAGPDIIPMLLGHLDLLKTPALTALKANPAYRGWQRGPAIAETELTPEEKLSVARGLREIPEDQKVRVLVSLAGDSSEEVRQAAQTTLNGLSDEPCAEAVADPSLEESVARYFLDPAHARPTLLAILLSQPAAPQDAITALAANAGPDLIPSLLDQLDLLRTPALVALKGNPAYLHWQKEPPEEAAGGLVIEADLLEMLIQEMQSESPQPAWDESAEIEQGVPVQKVGLLRKIAQMTVAQRVKLGLLGNREERALLIRDPSKVVSRAVLGSPKLTESEVESFAAMKNVSQEILRMISMNRKFIKNYSVLRNLASNARLPIDVGLSLLNRLMLTDLRTIASSKDIPDTTRKMAEKLYKSRRP